MYLLKMSGPKIWLCLFTFRPIALKKFKRPRVQFPAPARVFMFDLFLCFYFFCKKNNTLFVTKVYNSFYNFNLFSIIKILQDLWPIIRVWRYRPSIFNKHGYLDALHANKSKCFTVYCFLHCQIYFIDNFMKFLLNYHSYVDLQIIIKLILKFHFFVFNKWIFQYINFYI